MGASGSRDQSVQIILNIYDVSTSSRVQQLNEILNAVGTGAYHVAVEVYGKEWSYGYTEDAGTGVFSCKPRTSRDHTYRESVRMGVAQLSEKKVSRILRELGAEWRGADYDLVTRNCCNFCDEFCHRLGVGPIPDWTKNLAGAGAGLADHVRYAKEQKQALSQTLAAAFFLKSESVENKEQKSASGAQASATRSQSRKKNRVDAART